MTSEEPTHPPTGIAVEYCEEERRHELHYRKFSSFLILLHCQAYQARPTWTSAFREDSLDEKGEGKYGVVDQEEGCEDEPIKLVDKAEIRSPVLHQAVVRVEDEESTEKDGMEGGICVNKNRCEPSLSEQMKGKLQCTLQK